MPSLAGTVCGVAAACGFNAQVGPTFQWGVGFNQALITRTGPGDYTLTLTGALPLATKCSIKSGLQGSALGMIAVEMLTTTTIRIRTVNPAAAATDISFWLEISYYP